MNVKTSYRKRRTTKKTLSKSRALVVANKRGVSTAVKRYVKSTIHKEIENKRGYYTQTQSISSYVNSLNSLGAFPITPYANSLQILQGDGQSARSGNMIRTRKLVLSYIIYPAVYSATLNPYPVPQNVKIWIGFQKNAPMVQPTDFSRFFQTGDTASAPTSNLEDLIKPINTDVWTIKKQIVHKVGMASNTGSGGVITYGYMANNDYKFNAINKVDLTKYCPKTFKYSDAYSYTPSTGHALFMMIEAVECTGNTGGNGEPLKLKWWVDYVYEDA